MPSPIFAFFEVVAEELCSEPSRVITREDLQVSEENATLFDELKNETNSPTTEQAIRVAVTTLDSHFREKGSTLPFSYDPESGRFDAVDTPFLQFIKQMSNIRSIGTRSQEFELQVLEKLRGRVTGSLHRVGHPRLTKRKQTEFNAHLKTLGFTGNVLLGKDKDGGLDILWFLPLGSKPHRPIVSVQCKNGVFDMGEGDQSVGAGQRSLGSHGRLLASVHVPCVLYNDYLYPEIVTPKPMNFVPLGLTDLSPMAEAMTVEAI
jgi:hypothetical protein